jgi:hypothetical protein
VTKPKPLDGATLLGLLFLGVGLLFLLLGFKTWIVTVAFGAFFLLRGLVNRARIGRASEQFDRLGQRLDEVHRRMDAGESPGQIADALDRQYQIPPVQSLAYFALDRLRVIGWGDRPEEAAQSLAWLARDRLEVLPDPARSIPEFDFRRRVFASASEVSPLGSLSPGNLVATRTHLFYFAIPEDGPFEPIKDTVIDALPQALGLAQLGLQLAKGVHAELTPGSRPSWPGS